MKHAAMSTAVDNQIAMSAEEATTKLREALHLIELATRRAPSPPRTPRSDVVTAKEIRAILVARRAREQHFGGDLFADPAWDMLLELYAAEIAQHRLSVSSLCIGAAVPPTTALRWIATLERNGLVERQNDPLDGRRVFISLTAQGIESMDSYFRGLPEPLPVV